MCTGLSQNIGVFIWFTNNKVIKSEDRHFSIGRLKRQYKKVLIYLFPWRISIIAGREDSENYKSMKKTSLVFKCHVFQTHFSSFSSNQALLPTMKWFHFLFTLFSLLKYSINKIYWYPLFPPKYSLHTSHLLVPQLFSDMFAQI